MILSSFNALQGNADGAAHGPVHHAGPNAAGSLTELARETSVNTSCRSIPKETGVKKLVRNMIVIGLVAFISSATGVRWRAA